jgi:hypothetical protein
MNNIFERVKIIIIVFREIVEKNIFREVSVIEINSQVETCSVAKIIIISSGSLLILKQISMFQKQTIIERVQ